MRTVTLGKTGLTVSEFGFGGIPITRLAFKDAVAVVRYAFEQGITLFDTANAYRDSERKIGQALAPVRDEVICATKTSARDAKNAAKHVEKSLKSLRTSTIDLYQLHNVSNKETLEKVLAPGGAYEALEKARSQGTIRLIGLSSHSIPIAIKACRTGLFDTLQFPFNFIECEPVDKLFTVAMEKGMGIIAMKALGGGLLQRADLCFRFLQQYPYVVPIPGIEDKRELEEIIDLYRSPRPPSKAEWNEIERTRAELGTRFCHRCEYCLPCKRGVQISMILGFRSNAKRFPPSAVISVWDSAMRSLENCEECGECAEKCPYELPVPELLKESLSYFRNFVRDHR